MSNFEGKPKCLNDEMRCQHYLVIRTFVIDSSFVIRFRHSGYASLPKIICHLQSTAYFPAPTIKVSADLSTCPAPRDESVSEVGKIDN